LASLPTASQESVLDGTYFSGIEKWFTDRTAGRNTLLKYNTLLNMYVLHRPVIGDIVVTEDTLLPYSEPQAVYPEEIASAAEETADRVLSHARLCESYGGKYYYVAVPNQASYFEAEYPEYLRTQSEYLKSVTSALFEQFEAKGISYLDMGSVFDEKCHPEEYYSKIDHHYTISGAYETYFALIQRINSDLSISLKALDGSNSSVSALNNPCSGSRARKIFDLWASDETLSIITPTEDVPFVRYDNGTQVESSVYTLPGDDTSAVSYGSVYMGGDKAITELITNRPNLPTVLVYGDSFTNALESLIWYNCDTMYSIDLRYYNAGTLNEFIEWVKPDIVICVRDYSQLILDTPNGQ